MVVLDQQSSPSSPLCHRRWSWLHSREVRSSVPVLLLWFLSSASCVHFDRFSICLQKWQAHSFVFLLNWRPGRHYRTFDFETPNTSCLMCRTGTSSMIALAIWSLSMRYTSTVTWIWKEWYQNRKLVEKSELVTNWSSCLPEICGTGPRISAASVSSLISLDSSKFRSALGLLGS